MGYDREKTEVRLVEAVGSLLAEEGFSAMGLNAIARRARVNKTLIYRYFGSLDGLYAAFARSHTIWPPLEEVLGDVPARAPELPWADAVAEVLINYAHALRKRPLTIDLLAWECSERNALTVAFETVREQQSEEIFATMLKAGYQPSLDVRSVIALIASGMHYLMIRGRNIKVFSGAEVQSDAFWTDEMPRVIRNLMRGLSA